MGYVQTVCGPVAAEELGRVLSHEHLLSLSPGPWTTGGRGDPRVEMAVRAISELPSLGFRTVVDLTPYGILGRDPVALGEISRLSGIHIVAGAATYLEPYCPQWVLDADVEQLHQRFVADATEGCEGTGIKIGILGEQATGLNTITPHEEKCLRAAARAHRDTGLALNTHTTHSTMALEQLRILTEEGADLSRVVIGHMDIQADQDYVRRLLDAGVNVAFDTLGKQFWDLVLAPLPADQPPGEFTKRAYLRRDDARLALLVKLIAEGYVEQLLIATDMTGHEVYLNPTTHGQFGYSFLGRVIEPSLLGAGVSAAAVEQLLVHNPARILTIG